MNDHLRTSRAGQRLVQSYEGLRLTAYYCPAGILTIGYGHTNAAGTFPRVVVGLTITKQEAEEALIRDLAAVYEPIVRRNVKVKLNQGQFDALVSFVYNVGEPTFKKSTLLKKLNAGQYSAVPAELMKYSKARVKGQLVSMNGLVKRRAAEGALWSQVKAQAVQAVEPHEPVEPMPQKVADPSPGSIEKNIEKATVALPFLSAFAGLDWTVVAVIAVAAFAGVGAWLAYRKFVRHP